MSIEELRKQIRKAIRENDMPLAWFLCRIVVLMPRPLINQTLSKPNGGK
jgi:hypothetical protein